MWPNVACTRLSVSADVQKSERARASAEAPIGYYIRTTATRTVKKQLV